MQIRQTLTITMWSNHRGEMLKPYRWTSTALSEDKACWEGSTERKDVTCLIFSSNSINSQSTYSLMKYIFIFLYKHKMDSFHPTLSFLLDTNYLSPVFPVRNFTVEPTSTMLSIIRQPSTSNQSKQWIRTQIPVVALLHFNEISKVYWKWRTTYINREWSD